MSRLSREEARLLACIRRFAALLRSRPAAPVFAEAALLPAIMKELLKMSATFDSEMSQLRADIASQNTVIASATVAIQGLVAQLSAAEQAAKNAGATEAQVASLTALRQGLEANTATLAAAIPANTPAGSAPTSAASAPAAPATTQG